MDKPHLISESQDSANYETKSKKAQISAMNKIEQNIKVSLEQLIEDKNQEI